MSAPFPPCERGEHTICPRAVHVQSVWATAGTEPVPGVPAVTWEECDCACHSKGARS